MNYAQIDLRYVLYSLGYRGGLKGCERQLGMDRGNLSDIDLKEKFEYLEF